MPRNYVKFAGTATASTINSEMAGSKARISHDKQLGSDSCARPERGLAGVGCVIEGNGV